MIIEEFKSDATTIRVDNRDIVTKENNKELVNTLISFIIKKISRVKEKIFKEIYSKLEREAYELCHYYKDFLYKFSDKIIFYLISHFKYLSASINTFPILSFITRLA